MWGYPWEGHVSECGFERCKWLGYINAKGHIQDIKHTNADVESSTTMVKIQEWMPIRVLTRCKKQWEQTQTDAKMMQLLKSGSWKYKPQELDEKKSENMILGERKNMNMPWKSMLMSIL